MFFSYKKGKFYRAILEIAKNLDESAHYLKHFEIKNISDLKEFTKVMKEYETKGDTQIHELIQELNRSFFTPIKREDLLELGMGMDDILDGMEQCVALFEMYSIIHLDNYMKEFIHYIKEATIEILQAIHILFSKKVLNTRAYIIKIKDIESSCDELLRHSIKHLFTKETNVIKIIQYKEIYETLEIVIDNCQNVANTMETIVMKNG